MLFTGVNYTEPNFSNRVSNMNIRPIPRKRGEVKRKGIAWEVLQGKRVGKRDETGAKRGW